MAHGAASMPQHASRPPAGLTMLYIKGPHGPAFGQRSYRRGHCALGVNQGALSGPLTWWTTFSHGGPLAPMLFGLTVGNHCAPTVIRSKPPASSAASASNSAIGCGHFRTIPGTTRPPRPAPAPAGPSGQPATPAALPTAPHAAGFHAKPLVSA
jgi:hypothetical protein